MSDTESIGETDLSAAADLDENLDTDIDDQTAQATDINRTVDELVSDWQAKR